MQQQHSPAVGVGRLHPPCAQLGAIRRTHVHGLHPGLELALHAQTEQPAGEHVLDRQTKRAFSERHAQHNADTEVEQRQEAKHRKRNAQGPPLFLFAIKSARHAFGTLLAA